MSVPFLSLVTWFPLLVGTELLSNPEVDRKSAQQNGYSRVTWSMLPLKVKLRLIRRMIAAPKVRYQLEKLEVYQDAVWAWYTVRNVTLTRQYLAAMFLEFPLRRMQMWDSQGKEWMVSRFPGNLDLKNPDTFLSLEGTLHMRFRSRLTLGDPKAPLQLLNPDKARNAPRPLELTYWLKTWSIVYTELSESTEVRVPSVVFGFGKVPVKWFQKKSPKDWVSQLRLPG